MNKFLPIVLGSDLNTYSIAREIHEAYGINVVGASSMILSPCINSKIIDFHIKKNFSKDPDIFSEVLNEIYHKYKDSHEEFIIFAPDDVMRSFALGNIDKLDFNPVLPYAGKEVIASLATKKDFYEKIAKLGLAPNTIIATPENYKNLDYPADVFIKADNDVVYKRLDFDGWQKGYHSTSVGETIKILENVFTNGYTDGMIVQEFIAGGDGTEYSIDGYRSATTISMSACKNVMLDKRPDWVGNFVAKIDTDEEKILDYGRSIVEELGVYGLFNIDFKRDSDTGKIYAFEINLRQGRCHYYATQNGVNTSKIAIEDKIFGNQNEIIGDKPFAYYNLDFDETLSNMPENLKEEFTASERMKNIANPLIYERDNGIMRRTKISKYLDKLSAETFIYKEI